MHYCLIVFTRNMKKILLLLSLFFLVSCNNQRNQNSQNDSASTEQITENINQGEEADVSTNSEISIDFSSYHLYTCEEDKYDEGGYQPVSAKVTINEETGKASLHLYDSGTKKWYPFTFTIDDKLNLKEGVITYIVYNNAKQKGYIYVSTNRSNGLFIDINNFIFEGNTICCWMQEGDSNGEEYRQGAVARENTPNAYSSGSTYSPDLNSGNIQSNERIYGNYTYYEETDDCVEGVVVYEGEDDYYIVETKRGYTILERYSGSIYEGDRVRGELNRYGAKYLINRNNNSEVKVYIEDFALSDDDAIEWMGKNEHLNKRDQEAYDNNN